MGIAWAFEYATTIDFQGPAHPPEPPNIKLGRRQFSGCAKETFQSVQRVGNAARNAEPASADSLDIKFGSRQVGGLGDGVGPMAPPGAEPVQGLRPLKPGIFRAHSISAGPWQAARSWHTPGPRYCTNSTYRKTLWGNLLGERTKPRFSHSMQQAPESQTTFPRHATARTYFLANDTGFFPQRASRVLSGSAITYIPSPKSQDGGHGRREASSGPVGVQQCRHLGRSRLSRFWRLAAVGIIS